MEITIKSKYLIFPVNVLTTAKKLSFQKQEEKVYDLDIHMDNISPNFYAYIDVSRFMGETLDMTISPEMKIVYREADTMDMENLYQEALRPGYILLPRMAG